MTTNANSSPTRADWLKHATQRLELVGITTARLDAMVLLEDLLSTDRTQLLAHGDKKLSSEQTMTLNAQIKRRARHEPLAYIRGKSEFYGRVFNVNKDTLEPRPETETMIDLLKQIMENGTSSMEDKVTVVDVGTGSGCIAITAKLELPEAEVAATEINQAALDTAKRNATRLKTDITFYHGDLLEPATTAADLLLCNLPYVPDGHTINQAAMFEPRVAIFGGHDGLDIYRRLFEQIKALKAKPAYILTESLPFQHQDLVHIAEPADYKLAKTEDFIQLFKHDAKLKA